MTATPGTPHLSALLCLTLLCLPKGSVQGPHEKRVLEKLLNNYNVLERPVANESEPIVVSFGLTLQQIIDVDEKNQLLITNVWLNLEWNDVNLRWNASEYGGVQDLRIPPKKIWKPDVLMYNSADEKFDSTYPTNVVLKNNGSCLYIPPGIFKSTCKIDITWFPFDDQECDMKFGSWTYDGWQLDLILPSEEGDASNFIPNGEWTLLGVTILLSLTVFLNMVAESMPTTSDAVPLIGTYFNCIMFMVASSVVSTVLILNYHHRSGETHEMAPWVRSVFLQWMPWLLRMSRPGEKITRKNIIMNNKMKELELKERSSKSLLANVLDMDDDFRGLAPAPLSLAANSAAYTRLPPGQSVDDLAAPGCMAGCARELHLILRELRTVTDRLRQEDDEAVVTSDWKFAAMVVDRLCLIVFTLFTVVATVAVLLSAPHIIVP
ncbi:acetylcholine receptor subunit alpha-type acr-16-like isoform X8 [Pollicipes pollicipes]|uniref:acetylcholine receptor subunit alpha-type acr-16-like isoform X8 n=1 Tax=Pollicipes pollicipes TaxID=41117 RepID=UPI0018855B8E|nr:acetylcholine receptor subunit alpha-type acr-16-like isoform X8 [Pollicipes pollicipes]